eukprot:4210768-Prymnesium_polylepis.1
MTSRQRARPRLKQPQMSRAGISSSARVSPARIRPPILARAARRSQYNVLVHGETLSGTAGRGPCGTERRTKPSRKRRWGRAS